MEILDKSFLKNPRPYIVQSLLALITLAIILYFVEAMTEAAIVAALGSTTFIVFAMPRSIFARPRRLIGGHVVGILCGLACYGAFFTGPLKQYTNGGTALAVFAYALAVVLAIFLMVITNTEHAPAASTALGLVIHSPTVSTIIFILLCVVGLSIVRRLMLPYLRDLF